MYDCTSISALIPAGIKTSRDVLSSMRYIKITNCEKARHSTVRADRPANDLFRRQNETSFLKAKKSNSNCKNNINFILIYLKFCVILHLRALLEQYY